MRGLAQNFARTPQTENPHGFSEVGENKQLLIASVPVAQHLKYSLKFQELPENVYFGDAGQLFRSSLGHFQIYYGPVFNGLFISTLTGISFSTARGIIFERLSKTNMRNVILPVVSPSKLLFKDH